MRGGSVMIRLLDRSNEITVDLTKGKDRTLSLLDRIAYSNGKPERTIVALRLLNKRLEKKLTAEPAYVKIKQVAMAEKAAKPALTLPTRIARTRRRYENERS
jgi:hypothetical protein